MLNGSELLKVLVCLRMLRRQYRPLTTALLIRKWWGNVGEWSLHPGIY